jgi:transcriptional regulator with XRE-family HTH domain
MQEDEDIQVVGTMADYLIQKLMDEEQGQEFAFEYLKSAFLTEAINALFYMRRQAGLTQAQVAERLNTKQSAVARLEGDSDGGISLRRYVDFALACGMVPHDITFAPLESAISYTIAQAKIPYTQVNYQEWLKTNSQSSSASVESVAHIKSNFEATSSTLQTQSGAVFSFERSSGRSSAKSNNVASSATTLQNDLAPQAYFQPYLIQPLQMLLSGSRTSTASEPHDKTSNLAQSTANQSQIEVAA